MPKKPWPNYLQWRDGRPRWIPGPKLRAIGYKGRDLKDASGLWMSKGDAIDKAEEINTAIASGGDTALSVLPPQGPRTFEALFALFLESPGFKKLKRRTAEGYRGHLRILSAWAGKIAVAAVNRDMMKNFHAELAQGRGLSTANAVYRTLKLVLNFAKDDLEWIAINKAARLKLEQAKGSLVMWEETEIRSLVQCADWLGLEGVGDAVVQAVTSGQRMGDLLAAPEWRKHNGVYAFAPAKTEKHNGRALVPGNIAALEARLEKMRARKAERWPSVAFTSSIVDGTGRAYDPEGSAFQKDFARVRAIACGAVFAIEDGLRAFGGLPVKLRNLPFDTQSSMIGVAPSGAHQTKTFRDFRDTAVTFLFEAGCDDARIATITGHSLKTVRSILDKHYFVRNARMSLDAGSKFDRLLAGMDLGG